MRCLRPAGFAAVLGAVLLGGCSPALDWREVRPASSDLVTLFPCRPGTEQRPVQLGGATLPLRLVGCKAAETTFALALVDLPEPGLANGVLTDLRRHAVDNIAGQVSREVPFSVPGATPSAGALRIAAAGRLPDGTAIAAHHVFFTRGLKVYQASVMGARVDADAVETFLEAIKIAP
ncbi:hypothetical protein [Piscinibacter koreensis]|uniref:Lipoprotein n=1 Tax=Piscinibacter koreensis TaxID=2742824 RepID=A0A7Y6NKL2_9BURK|nr:hypothetical protein [Schlegelella koreensis]NUZ04887.1 hypothetical protein [Schlegelella koreensis]